MALIEITQLKKRFGSLEVLKGVNLDIQAGEVVAIIGRSGSGKSTLLRCLNGLEIADEGSVLIAGTHVRAGDAHLRKLRLKAGMVFQSFNLFPHLTAGRNIMLALTNVQGLRKAAAADIARDLLHKVRLAHKFDTYPDKLSGGEQQRVAIARALALKPVVLLCDEITSALDPELVGEVLSVIRNLAQDGMTLVLVTHEMRFARDVCTKAVFMHNGIVGEAGPPGALFDNPRNQELRRFLSSSDVQAS